MSSSTHASLHSGLFPGGGQEVGKEGKGMEGKASRRGDDVRAGNKGRIVGTCVSKITGGRDGVRRDISQLVDAGALVLISVSLPLLDTTSSGFKPNVSFCLCVFSYAATSGCDYEEPISSLGFSTVRAASARLWKNHTWWELWNNAASGMFPRWPGGDLMGC